MRSLRGRHKLLEFFLQQVLMDILSNVFWYVGDNLWTSVETECAVVLEFTVCVHYWNLGL
jgi:hypothetical protein